MSLRKTIQVDDRVQSNDILVAEEAEEVFMGMAMDKASIANITNLLTDLYENPIEATVREIVSNAIDATVKEGTSKPVQISTPTLLSPNFIVEDFGTGMSFNTVKWIYSQYGASTKGDDYSQIGAFGLGAKAPLAYCVKYSVETTKDGETTFFTVDRGAGGNNVSIFKPKETGKPNGTKITIPARTDDSALFALAISNYSKYSVDVPVEVDKISYSPAEKFLYLFDVELDENSDLEGRVWVNKDSIPNLISSNYLFGNSRYSAGVAIDHILSGWKYANPYSNNRSYNAIELLSELKPGVVDYTTSRDAIVKNDRSQELFSKIEETLSESAKQETYSHLMEYLRSLDADEMLHRVKDIVRAGGVPSDMEAGVTEWTANGIHMKLEDFTNKDGRNLLKEFHNNFKDFEKDANAAMIIGSSWSSRPSYSAADTFSGNVFNGNLSKKEWTYRSSVTDNNLIIKDAVNEDVLNLSVAETIAWALNYDSYTYAKSKFLVITEVEKIDKVLRTRLTLTKNGYENSIIFITALAKDKIGTQVLEGVAEVEFMTEEELFKWAKERNSRAKGSKRVAAATHTFYKIEEAEKQNYETYSFFSKFPQETKSLQEIFDYGHTLYLGQKNATQIQRTVYGASNSGVDVSTVYVPVEVGRLIAADYDLIKDYDNAIADSSFSYNSKSAKEIQEKKTYSGVYLNSRLHEIPEELLKRFFLSLNLKQSLHYFPVSLPGLSEDLLKVEKVRVTDDELNEWADLNRGGRIDEAIALRFPKFGENIAKINEILSGLSNFSPYSSQHLPMDEGIVSHVIRAYPESLNDETIKPFVESVVNKINSLWEAVEWEAPETITLEA